FCGVLFLVERETAIKRLGAYKVDLGGGFFFGFFGGFFGFFVVYFCAGFFFYGAGGLGGF
ncbi:hypothetical protein ACVGX7_10870, partial [Enterobacter hormaechei]